MDIDKKFIQLFGADPQGWMIGMSDARARLVYKAQKDAFSLGVEVALRSVKESKDDLRREQANLELSNRALGIKEEE